MQDLQEVTQDLHYENFRSERLKRGGRLSSHGYILPLSPAYVLLCLSFSTSSLSLYETAELCECSHRLFEYPRTGRTKQMYWNSTTLHSHFSFLLKTHINSHLIAEIEGEEQHCFASLSVILAESVDKLSSIHSREMKAWVLMCAVLTLSHGSAASCGICVHQRIGGGGTAGSSVTAPPVLQPDASTVSAH